MGRRRRSLLHQRRSLLRRPARLERSGDDSRAEHFFVARHAAGLCRTVLSADADRVCDLAGFQLVVWQPDGVQPAAGAISVAVAGCAAERSHSFFPSGSAAGPERVSFADRGFGNRIGGSDIYQSGMESRVWLVSGSENNSSGTAGGRCQFPVQSLASFSHGGAAIRRHHACLEQRHELGRRLVFSDGGGNLHCRQQRFPASGSGRLPESGGERR